MTFILKYLSILTFSCLCWGATEGSPFSKAVQHSPDPDLRLACKNIRFSSLFAAGDVSSPAAKSLVCFRRRLLFRRIIQALGRKTSRTFYFPRQRRFQKNIIIFELHWPKGPCTHKLCSKLKQFIIVFRSRLNFFSFHTFLREIVILDHC